MACILRNLTAAVSAVALVFGAATPCAAQGGADVQIVPGFEKVYRQADKKEQAALRELERANAETSAADAKRVEGEKLAADGTVAVEMGRNAYVEAVLALGQAKNASEARDEARKIEEVAKTWSVAEKEKARGEKMARDAEDALRAAEKRRLSASGALKESREAKARSVIETSIAEEDIEAATVFAAPSAPSAPEAVKAPPAVAAAKDGPTNLRPTAVSEDALPPPAPADEASPMEKVIENALQSDSGGGGGGIDDELLGGAPTASAPLKRD